MAEIIISPLLQILFEKLASPILMNLRLFSDYNKEFEKLKSTLPVIQAVIEEAEEQQLKDKKVKVWLRELKNVAYDIDDLLDELTTQILQKETKKKKVWVKKLSLKSLSNHYVMPRKLKQIREKLDQVAREMSNFQFTNRVVYERSETIERRQTGPYVDESQVFGRTKDVQVIVDILTVDTTENQNNVSVLPIVGIGGIGKTTVSQLVYNDPTVEMHFDLRMWVSVSHKFNLQKIMNNMLEYSSERKHEYSQIGLLESQLFEFLRGRRYLLVLDDVWTDDQDEWEKLRYPLRSGAKGSRVVVTTRNKKVASIMRTMQSFTLEGLDENECWNLFNNRAFEMGEDQNYPKLLAIGREIVKKCKGVPLAAKILGNLMRFKREESEWVHIRESELWNLEEGNNRMLSALRLSYIHLPSHLKRCFAYCSILPKNVEMSKDQLIRLWIAHGLIQTNGDTDTYSTKKIEDTGNEYFNDFFSMSFFQVASRNEGDLVKYRMHDLIHDLARLVMGNEFQMIDQDDGLVKSKKVHHSTFQFTNLSQTRHASIYLKFGAQKIPEAMRAAKGLRTLRFSSPTFDSWKTLATMFSAFKRLKELDLSGCNLKTLHKSIGSLVYLRYLNVSNTPLENLPNTIKKLCNLQTLDLTDCHNLSHLPSGITRLVNLRHLIIKDCSRLARIPPSIRSLLNLQTLPVFIVGPTFDESLFQLVHLDIRGELTIKHLENVGSVVPELFLEEKQLHTLKLSWGNDEEKTDHSVPRQNIDLHDANHRHVATLLNALQPHENLKKLVLNGYSGTGFTHWMSHVMLPNLTDLVLNNCRRCTKVPTLGQLPVLKILKMNGLNSVASIGSEFYGEEGNKGILFPSLEQLELKDFENLETWDDPGREEFFISLKILTITQCPKLKKIPYIPHLKHLELRKCNAKMLRSAAEMKSLSTLVIDSFPDLSHLPQGLLQNSPLISLTISSCPNLISLPWDLKTLSSLKSLTLQWCGELSSITQEIRHLTSLEYLEITECPSLVSLPEEGMKGLRSLKTLSIENCDNLTSLPNGINHLTSLEQLTIMYCPSLANLPNEFQHLSSLRSLNMMSCQEITHLPDGLKYVTKLENIEIRNCTNMRDLEDWVGDLVSLRSLAITGCKRMKCLPNDIKRLRGLQHLSIRECPELEERCRNDDWDTIAHVPYIYTGSSTSLGTRL